MTSVERLTITVLLAKYAQLPTRILNLVLKPLDKTLVQHRSAFANVNRNLRQRQPNRYGSSKRDAQYSCKGWLL